MAKKIKSLSAAELSCFCSEVALMLSSGMALYDGMEALAQTYRDTPFSEQYEAASKAVTETGSIHEALKADPRWPVYLAEMAGIGERTGRLEEVMRSMAQYYDREGRIRQAITSAVTYPIVLGIMLVLIVLVMLLKVMPVFRQVLGSMGVAMTATGQALTTLGSAIGWIVLALVGIAVLCVIAVLALLATKKREAVLSALRHAFVPIRKISAMIASSRVASVLSMMISGGYPLDEALRLVPSVLSDRYAIEKINVLSERIEKGDGFAQALNDSGLFDEMYNRMIQLGIASGRQDEVMAKVAGIYETQVEDSIANLVAVIEPTLVALLSIVIGAILLSVMLPMAGVISSIL